MEPIITPLLSSQLSARQPDSTTEEQLQQAMEEINALLYEFSQTLHRGSVYVKDKYHPRVTLQIMDIYNNTNSWIVDSVYANNHPQIEFKIKRSLV